MAYLLALETSSTLCSIALGRDTALIASSDIHVPHQHDRLLAVVTEQICTNAGIHIADIDAVCISAGPGSFSGLRIGAAFAKALCFSNRPALLAVPTLSALSSAYLDDARLLGADIILTTQASHKDILAWQAFSANQQGRLYEIGEPQKNTYSELCEILSNTYPTHKILCTGTAIIQPLSAMLDALPNAERIIQRYSAPTGVMIYQFGYELFQRGEFTLAEAFVPQYGQEFIPR